MHPTRRQFLAASSATLAALPLASAKNGIAAATGALPAIPQHVQLNVRDFSATGDGSTKDTLAFQQALDRCSFLGGGEVFVPQGDYLIGTIVLHSNTHLRLDDGASLLGSADLTDYPLTQVRWEGHWIRGYGALITAIDSQNIAISGAGRIVGNPAIRGRVDKQTGLRNPALLEFTNCSNLQVAGCITEQNEMWSIHPVYCENVSFHGVTVRGGADGIDIDSCRHVVIESCNFATGDDCISLKSGRGAEGYAIARPTEDVLISNCTFADTHWACIGIGSETSGGIRNVRIEQCRCTEARTFAIYIKTRSGRGAFIENIHVDGLDVSGAQQGFLRINLLDSGKQDEFPVPGNEGLPSVHNLSFRNIRVDNVPVLVQATSTLSSSPIFGFILANITGTCAKGVSLANIQRADLSGIAVTGLTGPLLSAYNVKGKGVSDAAPLAATPAPAPVPPPATPYHLR
jgi:polygalacturonase